MRGSSHYDAISSHCLARRQKAENPQTVDSPPSGPTSGTTSGPRLAKCQKAENPITEPTDQPKIWPKGMMDIIKSIVNLHSSCPEAPLFTFKMTAEAAEKIFLVLKSFNFDVKRALEAQAKSPVGYS